MFEFSFEGASFIPTGLSPSGNPLVGSAAFFDANGNQLPDAGEPMTFTDSQGRAPLHVPYKFFDKNGDQIIDDRDGRIVILDGVDVKNNLPQLEPLVAVPQAKIISPITTRVSALVDQGFRWRKPKLRLLNTSDRVSTNTDSGLCLGTSSLIQFIEEVY